MDSPENDHLAHQATQSEQKRHTIIAEILSAIPEVRWSGDFKDKPADILRIELPHNCYIEGSVNSEAHIAKIDFFQTHKFSGAGIGTKLLRAFVVEVKKLGINIIKDDGIISISGLRARVSILGPENSSIFIDPGYPSKARRCSYEEAMETLEKREKGETDDIVEVEHDLTNFDASEWDKPKAL